MLPDVTKHTRATSFAHSIVRPLVKSLKILHGPSAGKPYFIPRIHLIPADSDLPFQFRRLQYPIRPCFAMTINKSQGQTFKHIGIDLSTPVFSPGMLYFAMPRVGCKDRLRVYSPTSSTRNGVYTDDPGEITFVTRFLPSENKVYTYIHTYVHTYILLYTCPLGL